MFVGRERELAELEAGLDEAREGRGRLFLLAGEAGIGKTRLCDELALRASQRGLAVRWGRCWEVGGAPAYWPWIQLLRGLLREHPQLAERGHVRDSLARILPELGGAAHPAPLDSAEQRFQLFDAVSGALREAAGRAPLLLILDDLHAADPSSLALLLFVARELRDLRACLIGTYRDRELREAAELREALARIVREAQTFEIARFTPHEVRTLLVSQTGSVEDEVLDSVYGATEGLPLFVTEVARARPQRGSWAVPETIRAALHERIAALPEAVRTLLEAAAVFGRETPRATLAALLEQPEEQLLPQLSAAIATGVAVEPEPGLVAFSHALLRDAIYRELPELRRVELHERAAEVLTRTRSAEAGLAELANHLLAALARVGPERALDGSLRAAERALRTYAFEDAVAILEHALRVLEPTRLPRRGHCEALLMLGEASIRAHREGRQACLQAADLARQLNDATLLARAGLALGAEIWAGRVNPTLIGLLEEALRALPDTPSPLRARVLARLSGAMQPADDPAVPMQIARQAIRMARALGDEACLRAVLHGAGSALVDYAPLLERLDVDRQTLELAEAAHDWPLAFRANIRLYFTHLEHGTWNDAAAAVTGCATLADKLHQPRLHWYVAMLRALSADLHGDFAAADSCRAQAEAIAARDEDAGQRVPYAMHRFAHALLRHEHDRLFERLPALAASSAPAVFAEIVHNVLLAACAARTGQREQAIAHLSRVDLNGPWLRYEAFTLHMLSETCVLCELREPGALLLERLSEFREHIASWGVFGLAAFGPVSGTYAGLLAVLGRYDEALQTFEAAAARCKQLGARPSLARVLYDWGRTLARTGDATRARALFEQAASLARELHMPGLSSWIEAELGRLQVPPNARRTFPPPPAAGAHAPLAFGLQREGDVWKVQHGALEFRLKHSRGLAMLAQLVEQPGRELHALALGSSADAGELGDAGEAIDAQAARAYRERIEELRERQQTAETLGDGMAAERARSEIEDIARHLSAALGLGGKGRKAAAASERARVNVQRRIKDAIARIAAEDPELGRYLRACVRTGTFSVFEPISWSPRSK